MAKEEKDDIFTPVVNMMTQQFGEDKIIPHEWFKNVFGMEKLEKDDFETTEEFLAASDKQSFEYLSTIQALTDYMLKNKQMCLRNVWGEGYLIIPSEKQVRYGYDTFCDEFKKSSRKCKAIMNHVRPVSAAQAAADNDLRAKAAALQMAFKAM